MLDAAAEIAAAVKRRAEVVGVFVNATLDEVAQTADGVGLTMLQLHGDEGPAFCAEVARRTGCKVIKAVARAQRRRRPGAGRVPHRLSPARQLHGRACRGGTGETFSWELARGPSAARVPLILVGRPDARQRAPTRSRPSHPYAVDVASGVEPERPARKDPDKLVGVRGGGPGRRPVRRRAGAR